MKYSLTKDIKEKHSENFRLSVKKVLDRDLTQTRTQCFTQTILDTNYLTFHKSHLEENKLDNLMKLSILLSKELTFIMSINICLKSICLFVNCPKVW